MNPLPATCARLQLHRTPTGPTQDRPTTLTPPAIPHSPSQPTTLHGNGCPPSPSPTSARARARARTPTQLPQTPHHAAALTAHDEPPPTVPPRTAAGGIEVEYARISRVITTALHGGDARPCHLQARAVLNVHRNGSAKRRGAIALLPAARVQHRYRALMLLLHPDRTAPELLRHRTMARLAWDAVQTAQSGTYGSGRRAFPSRETSPPRHTLHGALAPSPSCGLSRIFEALPHTPTTHLSHSTPQAAHPTGTHHIAHPGATRPRPGPAHPDSFSPRSQLECNCHVSIALAPE